MNKPVQTVCATPLQTLVHVSIAASSAVKQEHAANAIVMSAVAMVVILTTQTKFVIHGQNTDAMKLVKAQYKLVRLSVRARTNFACEQTGSGNGSTASCNDCGSIGCYDTQCNTTLVVHLCPHSSWEAPYYVHYHDTVPTESPSSVWPGLEMTSDEGGWYTYVFTSATSTAMEFNDGGNGYSQTESLSRDGEEGWFVVEGISGAFRTGTWYNTREQAVADGAECN